MSTKLKWFDAGNVAHGFVAVGNVATGFIAIGNVARGVIAVGNLAIGVVSAGNVGFGMLFGAGATVGIGLGSVAGVLPIAVVGGVGGVTSVSEVPVLIGMLPVFLWGILSLVMPGTRTRRELPALVSLTSILAGTEAGGWVLGRLVSVEGTRLQLRSGGRSVACELDRTRAQGLEPRPREVLVRLRPEVRSRQDEGRGYREGVPRETVLVCDELQVPPPHPRLWQTPADVQWMLARAWRVAAAVGLLGWTARVVLLG